MYQLKKQQWNICPYRFSAESALEPVLPLCFGCKFIKCGPCFLGCPRVLQICISASVNVQLVESTPLVFTVSSFSASVFCPVRFVCGISSPRHHSIVTCILPWLLLAWVRKAFPAKARTVCCLCLVVWVAAGKLEGRRVLSQDRLTPRWLPFVFVLCK